MKEQEHVLHFPLKAYGQASPLVFTRPRMFGQLTLEIFMTHIEGRGHGPRLKRFVFLFIDVLNSNNA